MREALWLAQSVSVLCASYKTLMRREPQLGAAEPATATGKSPIQVTASGFWYVQYVPTISFLEDQPTELSGLGKVMMVYGRPSQLE